MGDGDPIDVIELGGEPLGMGAIVPVKVIGSLVSLGNVIAIACLCGVI
jgi:inorganic pyrophosphatase